MYYATVIQQQNNRMLKHLEISRTVDSGYVIVTIAFSLCLLEQLSKST